MRIAVVSDIHANLEALEAVLAHLDGQAPELIVCLGDFVGYGPDPNASVDLLSPRLRAAVVGNHDLAAIGARPIDDFNLFAQEAIVWTQRALAEGSRAYLGDLPQRVDVEGLLLVHGSPRVPVDEYILDTRTARASFVAQSICVLEVSRTLGRTASQTFWQVALPLARPALAAGVALSLMETLNDIGAVEFFGVRTLTAAIYDTWLDRNSLAGAAQIAVMGN